MTEDRPQTPVRAAGPVPGVTLEAVASVLRAHPGLAVTGLYVAATGVGMMSSWTLYRRFGLDIFHYAQLQDFMVAAVRTPAASLAVVLALPAVLLLRASDRRLERWVSWYKYLYGPAWLRRMNRSVPAYVLYFAMYAYAFSLLYSSRTADRIRDGQAPEVTVQLQGGTYRGHGAGEAFSASLLGTTSGYVILYEVSDGTVTVIPVDNVATLTVVPSGEDAP